jgi:hypothetical protein
VRGSKIKTLQRFIQEKKFRTQVDTADPNPTSTSEPFPSASVHENELELIDVSFASEVDVENASLNNLPLHYRNVQWPKQECLPQDMDMSMTLITMSHMHPYLQHIEHLSLHCNPYKFLDTGKRQNKIPSGVMLS